MIKNQQVKIFSIIILQKNFYWRKPRKMMIYDL